MIAEIINNRFWLADFEVYYKAAERILRSESLYRIAADKHYVFKYSPTSAIFFIPFLIFPFAVAKYVYWIFLTSIIVTGFYLSVKLIKPSLLDERNAKPYNTIILFATLILAVHFLRELHLGQVNYLLFFIFMLALYLYNEKKSILFSLLLAISIFIKPFTLIFIPYLILKRKYLELILFTGFSAALFLLPFLFYGSVEITLHQYQLWITELQIELSNKQGLFNNANHTIFSIFARYTPIGFILVNSTMILTYQLVLLSGIGLALLWFIKIDGNAISESQQDYYSVIEFSLLISLIPLLAYTSENAFIYAQLLVFIILLYFKKLKQYEKILAIVAFAFIGGNFSELFGKTLSKIIDDISLISVGTLILFCLVFAMRKRGSFKNQEINH